MFKKKDNKVNERVIYQAKPNLILGCKKAVLGFILLIFVIFVSGPVIQFVGEMQVYLISHIKLSLTRYTAIGMFVLMLAIIIYIIWQILGWYAKEYILTDSRIMVKSGVLLSRKNYMPYSTIQDINVSQSILARMVNVGSVSIYNAYDNTQMVLENISNPSEIEEIIFSRISGPRRFNPRNNRFNLNGQQDFYDVESDNRDDFYANRQVSLDYYDDRHESFEEQSEDDYYAITPIHEEEQYQRRQYQYYPEDLNYDSQSQRPKYEYEPYEHNLERNISRALNEDYETPGRYNDSRQDYSYGEDDYYYNSERNDYPNESVQKDSKNDMDESSESVIKRHFDKFKK